MEPQAPLKPTRICIVESLRPEDHDRTGYTIYKKLSDLFESDSDPGGMQVEYHEAPTEVEFLAALREVGRCARGPDTEPLVHVEAHGGPEGLHLGDGAPIPWKRLGDLLLPINEATRNRLFVVLAACTTVPVVQIFLPVVRTPFWHMIVSCRIALPSEILDALWSFYSTLHETHHAAPALQAMQEQSDAFGYTDGALIMKSVYEYHLKKLGEPEYFERRARDVVDERVMRAEIPLAHRSLVIHTLINEYRQDPVQLFRRYAEKYFWLDRFPEMRKYFEREVAAITKDSSEVHQDPS